MGPEPITITFLMLGSLGIFCYGSFVIAAMNWSKR
jgi:hypothetical protein